MNTSARYPVSQTPGLQNLTCSGTSVSQGVVGKREADSNRYTASDLGIYCFWKGLTLHFDNLYNLNFFMRWCPCAFMATGVNLYLYHAV